MRKLFSLILFVLLVSVASAHTEVKEGEGIDEFYIRTSLNYVIAAFIVSTILIFIAIRSKDKASEHTKAFLFFTIAAVVILATLYSAGSTIYVNVISETKGPVHWHADFEIWNCGEKVDIVDPTGFSNRIGTPTYHEHGDDRVHVEGVVMKLPDVDLHTFFNVIGGSLKNNRISLPTNNGVFEAKDGDLCNGQPGKLQAFVYKIENPDDRRDWTYTQIKIEDFSNYILNPFSNIPPGDCIIIEFDREKDSTDKLCVTFEVAIQRGELSGS